jgi:hypothetical protein
MSPPLRLTEVAEWPRWRDGVRDQEPGAGSQESSNIRSTVLGRNGENCTTDGPNGSNHGDSIHSIHGGRRKERKRQCGWIEWNESWEFDPFDPRNWVKRAKMSVWMDRMDRILSAIRSTSVGGNSEKGSMDGPNGTNHGDSIHAIQLPHGLRGCGGEPERLRKGSRGP